MITVHNTKPTYRRLRGVDEKNKVMMIKLDPGANLVSEKDLENVKKSPFVRELFRRGILEEKGPPSESKSFDPGVVISDLSELKVTEAIKAIENCSDVAMLKKWSLTEPRKGVKAALIKRHDVLTGKAEEEKE